MGQFSVTIYGATGSVLSDIQQHILKIYFLFFWKRFVLSTERRFSVLGYHDQQILEG